VAITQAQRQQVARLPLANGTLDESGDRYALAGIVEALSVGSSNITQAQRQQLARMPVADGTLDQSGDRYAMAGIVQAIDAAGNIVDLFETTWIVDPTWEADQLPTSNDGQVLVEIAGFISGLVGSFLTPEATGNPDLIAIQIPLTRVQEETAFTATVYFRDRATSSAVSPATARYRIDCKETGRTVLDWTSITTGATISIPILPEHNQMLSHNTPDRRTERKQLIVESNTGTTTVSLGKVTWTVANVFGVN